MKNNPILVLSLILPCFLGFSQSPRSTQNKPGLTVGGTFILVAGAAVIAKLAATFLEASWDPTAADLDESKPMRPVQYYAYVYRQIYAAITTRQEAKEDLLRNLGSKKVDIRKEIRKTCAEKLKKILDKITRAVSSQVVAQNGSSYGDLYNDVANEAAASNAKQWISRGVTTITVDTARYQLAMFAGEVRSESGAVKSIIESGSNFLPSDQDLNDLKSSASGSGSIRCDHLLVAEGVSQTFGVVMLKRSAELKDAAFRLQLTNFTD